MTCLTKWTRRLVTARNKYSNRVPTRQTPRGVPSCTHLRLFGPPKPLLAADPTRELCFHAWMLSTPRDHKIDGRIPPQSVFVYENYPNPIPGSTTYHSNRHHSTASPHASARLLSQRTGVQGRGGPSLHASLEQGCIAYSDPGFESEV